MAGKWWVKRANWEGMDNNNNHHIIPA